MEYRGQSGGMNEAYSDILGKIYCMRCDYLLHYRLTQIYGGKPVRRLGIQGSMSLTPNKC